MRLTISTLVNAIPEQPALRRLDVHGPKIVAADDLALAVVLQRGRERLCVRSDEQLIIGRLCCAASLNISLASLLDVRHRLVDETSAC
jgi:hypothetical protein